jgi:uncharacterized membrane protein
MLLLDIVTVLCIGPLIGVEFAVSVFINPIVGRLEKSAQAQPIRMFAARLGKAMPPWYIVSLLLLIAGAVAHRGTQAGLLLMIASGLWVAVVLVTVLFLVPINNRMMRMDAASFNEGAQRDHARWDTVHRLRVAALAAAFCCVVVAWRL